MFCQHCINRRGPAIAPARLKHEKLLTWSKEWFLTGNFVVLDCFKCETYLLSFNWIPKEQTHFHTQNSILSSSCWLVELEFFGNAITRPIEPHCNIIKLYVDCIWCFNFSSSLNFSFKIIGSHGWFVAPVIRTLCVSSTSLSHLHNENFGNWSECDSDSSSVCMIRLQFEEHTKCFMSVVECRRYQHWALFHVKFVITEI